MREQTYNYININSRTGDAKPQFYTPTQKAEFWKTQVQKEYQHQRKNNNQKNDSDNKLNDENIEGLKTMSLQKLISRSGSNFTGLVNSQPSTIISSKRKLLDGSSTVFPIFSEEQLKEDGLGRLNFYKQSKLKE